MKPLPTDLKVELGGGCEGKSVALDEHGDVVAQFAYVDDSRSQ